MRKVKEIMKLNFKIKCKLSKIISIILVVAGVTVYAEEKNDFELLINSTNIRIGSKSIIVPNSISFGNEEEQRKLVYIADGEISENSKEAINGSQIFKLQNLLMNGIYSTLDYEFNNRVRENKYSIKNDKPVGTYYDDINNKLFVSEVKVPDRSIINEYINNDKIDEYIREHEKYKTKHNSGSEEDRKSLETINKIIERLNNVKNGLNNYDGSFEKFENLRNALKELADDKNIVDYFPAGENVPNIGNGLNIFKDLKFDKLANILEYTANKNKVVLSNLLDGEISENSSDAINGSQLYKLKNELNENFDIYIKKDGSNIDEDSKIAIVTRLSDGASIDKPTGSVITDTKLKEVLEIKNYVSNNDLEKYAKKDLSNVDKETIIEKVGNGNLENTNGELVKDTVIKSYLTDKFYDKIEIDNKFKNINIETKGDIVSDTLEVVNGKDRLVGTDNLSLEIKNGSITNNKLSQDVKNIIDNKLNKDGDNLTDIGSENLINKLSDGASIEKPIGKLVKDLDIKKYLDSYNSNSFNLDEFMESVDEKFKGVNAGIAQAIAMGMLLQSNSKYYVSINAATTYYNKQGALAIGVSGSDKSGRFMYKLGAGLDTKLNFSLGLGIGVNIAKIKEEPIVKEIKVVEKVKDTDLEVELKNENNVLNKKLNELLDEINRLKKDINNMKIMDKKGEIAKEVIDKFEFDKYNLSAENKEKIKEFFVKYNPEIIVLSGHADEVGSDEYNQKLSEKRAEEVYKFIKNELSLKSEIYFKGFGKKYPVSQDDNSLNRRVEIEIK